MEKNIQIERARRIGETVYLFFLAVFLLEAFLKTTMFSIDWPTNFHKYIRGITLAVVIFRLSIFPSLNWKKGVFMAMAGGGAWIASEISGYAVLQDVLILALGAQGISFRKILAVYLTVLGPALLVTILSALGGKIENLIYYSQTRRPRISFGIGYPTDFAAYLFFGTLAYCYWRKTVLRYGEIIVILGLAAFCNFFCDARTSTIGLILIALGCSIARVWAHIKGKGDHEYYLPKSLKFLISLSPIFFAGFIWITTILYQEGTPFLAWLNEKLSGRLALGNTGFHQYGIRLFGQQVPMVGNGMSTEPRADYFFLDSSYILIGLRFGFVVLVLICILFLGYFIYSIKRDDTLLMILLAVMLLQCMIEHHLLEYVYNPFLLLGLAKWDGGCMALRRTNITKEAEVERG